MEDFGDDGFCWDGGDRIDSDGDVGFCCCDGDDGDDDNCDCDWFDDGSIEDCDWFDDCSIEDCDCDWTSVWFCDNDGDDDKGEGEDDK